MPFDYGLRLHNRQRLANARAKPIEANKNQSVDGAEGLFLRSGSPQNVYLLPQHPNFRLERCPRPKQICDHPNNEPDKISHPPTTSPDSRSTASQIEFAIGTGGSLRSWRTRSSDRLRWRLEWDRRPSPRLAGVRLRQARPLETSKLVDFPHGADQNPARPKEQPARYDVVIRKAFIGPSREPASECSPAGADTGRRRSCFNRLMGEREHCNGTSKQKRTVSAFAGRGS
jgi:hypothetical protein